MTKIQLRFAPSIVLLYREGDAPMVGLRIPKAKKILYQPGEAGWKEFTKPLSSLFADLQKMRRRRIQTILTYVMATDRLDDDDFVIAV